MKSSFRLTFLFLLLALTFMLSTVGCGGGDDDELTTEDDDTGVDDDADDDAADDDATDDDADDDADDDTTWTGSETVVLDTPDGTVSVPLFGLPAFVWNDPEDGLDKTAIYVKTVVDQVDAPTYDPNEYKFNFIASDDYNILANKADGDYRKLPSYENLSLGWFIEYDETGEKYTDIQVIWDESLGFPNYMGAKMMNGGTIQLVENVLFDQDVYISVDWFTKGAKSEVNLNGMPAFDDGGALAVRLHLVVLEAALENFDPKTYDYAFNFISNDADGNWNLLANLSDVVADLPVWSDETTFKDVHHGWIEDADTDGYRLFWDEATGFTDTYGVKHMDDGYIVVYALSD